MRPADRTRAPADGLARVLIEALAADPAAIARLREIVGPQSAVEPPKPIAYTVASLAAMLNVSDRVVRGAIARGELDAAKRGGRYVISARAVDDWTAGDSTMAPRRGTQRSAARQGPLQAALAALDDPGRASAATTYDRRA